jgi:hypothetical protein
VPVRKHAAFPNGHVPPAATDSQRVLRAAGSGFRRSRCARKADREPARGLAVLLVAQPDSAVRYSRQAGPDVTLDARAQWPVASVTVTITSSVHTFEAMEWWMYHMPYCASTLSAHGELPAP